MLGGIEFVILLALAHILLSTQTSAQAEGSFALSYFSTMVAVISAAIFFSLGLYNRTVISNVQMMMARMLIGCLIVGVVSYFCIKGYFLVYPADADAYPPRYYFYLPSGILLGISILISTRVLFLFLADLRMFRQRILFIGDRDQADQLRQQVQSDQALGFDIVGVVTLGDGTPPIAARAAGAESLHVDAMAAADTSAVRGLDAKPGEIAELVRYYEVDEIVVVPEQRGHLPVEELLDCKLRGVRATEYLTFVERELGRIQLDRLDAGWMVFSDGFNTNRLRTGAKTAFDVAISLILLLFTAPIVLVTAVLIKLESPGPVFYRQERVGLNGKPFTLIKFRSMTVDAEKHDGPRWADVQDSRVTEVGRFIRKTRIDEIPQIINALRGEMSLIGPRPERPFFVDSLCKSIPYYGERHRVKPGITGWAQINYPYGASIEDAREKLAYDLYYVKNGSLFLDFIILLQTVRVILWPQGAR